MIRAASLGVSCAALVASAPARAAGPGLLYDYDFVDLYALPDAPAPPSLPDLTHRALAVSLETTFGSIRSNAGEAGESPSRSAAWIERLEVERAVAMRRFYVGGAFEVAAGSPPGGGGTAFVAGQPELWARAVWASRAGLAYGGGLGVVVPVIAHDEDSQAAAVQESVRVVRPWDNAAFANQTLTLRPFIDVRDIDGRTMLQLRQGLEWSEPVGSAGPPSTLASRTTLYVGYRVLDELGVGIEASEVYVLRSPDVSDDARAVYALSPGVRLMTRALQPALSAIIPLDRTLFGVVDSYWAVRLNLAVVIDSLSQR